jgi:hypothetical protein
METKGGNNMNYAMHKLVLEGFKVEYSLFDAEDQVSIKIRKNDFGNDRVFSNKFIIETTLL